MSIASPVSTDTRLTRLLVPYTATVDGLIFSRLGPPPNWRRSAQTVQQLPATGSITFFVPPSVVGAIVGLAVDGITFYPALTHGLYFKRGWVQPVELGVLKSSSSTFLDSDQFGIVITGTSVAYQKNGTTFYTSATAISGSYHRPYAFLYTAGDAIWNMAVVPGGTGVNHGTAYALAKSANALGVRKSGQFVRGRATFPVPRVFSMTSEFTIPFNVGVVDGHFLLASGREPIGLNLGRGTSKWPNAVGVSGRTYGIGRGYALSKPGRAYGSAGANFLATYRDHLGVHAAFAKAYELRLSIRGQIGVHSLSVAFVGLHVSIIKALGVHDRTKRYRRLLSIIKSLGVHDVTRAKVALIQSILAHLSAHDRNALRIALQAAIFSHAGFAGAGVSLRDEGSETWVVNIEKGQSPRPGVAGTTASVRYDNFNFNSMMLFRGKAYGARASGIYLLEGDDDSGEPIQASMNFGKLRFNSTKLKQLPAAYVGTSSSGALFLRVVERGQEYIYKSRSFDEELATQRFDLGRGLKSNFFEFELFNGPGNDMELDSIEFVQVPVTRRIR